MLLESLVVAATPCLEDARMSGCLLLLWSAWQRGVARNLWMMAKGAVGG